MCFLTSETLSYTCSGVLIKVSSPRNKMFNEPCDFLVRNRPIFSESVLSLNCILFCASVLCGWIQIVYLLCHTHTHHILLLDRSHSAPASRCCLVYHPKWWRPFLHTPLIISRPREIFPHYGIALYRVFPARLVHCLTCQRKVSTKSAQVRCGLTAWERRVWS